MDQRQLSMPTSPGAGLKEGATLCWRQKWTTVTMSFPSSLRIAPRHDHCPQKKSSPRPQRVISYDTVDEARRQANDTPIASTLPSGDRQGSLEGGSSQFCRATFTVNDSLRDVKKMPFGGFKAVSGIRAVKAGKDGMLEFVRTPGHFWRINSYRRSFSAA